MWCSCSFHLANSHTPKNWISLHHCGVNLEFKQTRFELLLCSSILNPLLLSVSWQLHCSLLPLPFYKSIHPVSIATHLSFRSSDKRWRNRQGHTQIMNGAVHKYCSNITAILWGRNVDSKILSMVIGLWHFPHICQRRSALFAILSRQGSLKSCLMLFWAKKESGTCSERDLSYDFFR